MKLFNARFLFLSGVVLTGLSLLATPAHAQDGGSGVAGAMSNLFAVLCVVALICLIWGWKDPKRFEFAFGDKATMPIVRGTFGVALLLFGFLGQSLDPNKSAAQVAANERRVAQSEAKVQDAKKRELEAKENERAARESQRTAQQEARDSQTLARRAQKEKARAENNAAAAKARQIRDDERAREQRESDSQEGSKSPESKSSANLDKKIKGLLDNVVKTQRVQSYAETDGVTLTLRNRDDFTWTDIKININPTFGYIGGYEYRVKQMRSGGEIIVPLREFANPKGERLNSFEIKLQKLALRCKTPDGIGVDESSWPSK